MNFRSRTVLLGALACSIAATATLLASGKLPREMAWMTGIFTLAALLWMTEALPLFATSLAVIGLEILLLANPGSWPLLGFEQGASPPLHTFLASAADPILLLFFGGMLMARAAVKEGVDIGLASLIVRPCGGRPALVLLGVILTTALFSMWMSNTAAAAMMMTLARPLLSALPKEERFRKALILAIPFAANVGGMGTPIGTPPNAIAAGYLRAAGVSIGFLRWMIIATPLMVGLLLGTWLLLWTCYRPQTPGLRLPQQHRPMTRRGGMVVGVFVVTVSLWLTEPWHGLPAPLVALVPVVTLTAAGILGAEDLGEIDWSVLILIGGGMALGTGMKLTRLDEQMVGLLTGIGRPVGEFGVWAALVLGVWGLSNFISNTAAANLVLPVGLSLAASRADALRVAPQFAMGIALAASAAMTLPVSTPPNALAFSHGEITSQEMARSGLCIGLAALLLILGGSGPVIGFWHHWFPLR